MVLVDLVLGTDAVDTAARVAPEDRAVHNGAEVRWVPARRGVHWVRVQRGTVAPKSLA